MLASAALVSQANAGWFHDPQTGMSRNLGSAPSPKPQDLLVIREGANYPLQSRMFNEQGKVELNVMLTESGRVSDAVVSTSSGYPRLDDAAVRYMKGNWHFKPSKDEPMPKTVQAEVVFKLQ